MADDIVTISEFIAKEVGFYSPGMLVQAQDLIAWLAEHGFAVVVADETERLRAAGDALAKQITKPCRCVEAHDGAINETCAPCAAFFDWQEARRDR